MSLFITVMYIICLLFMNEKHNELALNRVRNLTKFIPYLSLTYMDT